MSCIYICDGCGKQMKASHNGLDWLKPHSWYQRSDDDGPQDACCRECIEKVSQNTGKTHLVAPF